MSQWEIKYTIIGYKSATDHERKDTAKKGGWVIYKAMSKDTKCGVSVRTGKSTALQVLKNFPKKGYYSFNGWHFLPLLI